MKLAVRVATVMGVLLVASAPVLAQPGADETPPARQPPEPIIVVAPMTDDWNNVSHINGQIVKVGEKSEYLIDYKKTNFSANPIGWMFGFYGLSVSHAVSQHVAVRADASFMDLDGVNGWELGLTVPIYFKRVYQGPFLEGGLMARQFGDDDELEMSSPDVGPQVMFGWHWSFDSGANVAFAFGAFRPMNDKSSDDPQPAGYFRIGYAY